MRVLQREIGRQEGNEDQDVESERENEKAEAMEDWDVPFLWCTADDPQDGVVEAEVLEHAAIRSFKPGPDHQSGEASKTL